MKFHIVNQSGDILSTANSLDESLDVAAICVAALRISVYVEEDGVVISCLAPADCQASAHWGADAGFDN